MALQQDRTTTIPVGIGGSVASAARRNRVLRNTYMLLALSMVPTVLGAWIGVSTGFTFFASSPFIGLIAFLGDRLRLLLSRSTATRTAESGLRFCWASPSSWG